MAVSYLVSFTDCTAPRFEQCWLRGRFVLGGNGAGAIEAEPGFSMENRPPPSPKSRIQNVSHTSDQQNGLTMAPISETSEMAFITAVKFSIDSHKRISPPAQGGAKPAL